VCGKTKSKSKKDFTSATLKQHMRSCHPSEYIRQNERNLFEYDDPILDMADLLAGGESYGLYWGIAYELGYFG
jgi:hypothetical protein